MTISYPPLSAVLDLADRLHLSWTPGGKGTDGRVYHIELLVTMEVARDGETIVGAWVGHGIPIPPHAIFDCLIEVSRLASI